MKKKFSLFNMSSKFVSMALSFLNMYLMTEMYSYETIGEYVLFNTLFSLLSTISLVGLNKQFLKDSVLNKKDYSNFFTLSVIISIFFVFILSLID